jgi:hypothetical protein
MVTVATTESLTELASVLELFFKGVRELLKSYIIICVMLTNITFRFHSWHFYSFL